VLPVTKTLPAEVVEEAYELGLREFGENTAQELCAKAPVLPADVRWHMIGHLQRNKARKVAPIVACVQSVDSLRIAEALAAAARDVDRKVPVLVEVNTSGEASKHGLRPQAVVEELAAIAAFEHLEVQGLMTLGPTPVGGSPDERTTRAAFQLLHRTAHQVAAACLENVRMHEISMGMSGDMEWAVEEGATIVRVGTALFGPRGR
jgi:pyridoxal phosphate enzyme (YggS family)